MRKKYQKNCVTSDWLQILAHGTLKRSSRARSGVPSMHPRNFGCGKIVSLRKHPLVSTQNETVVASRNVICFLRPIHVSRRNGKLAVRQLLKKVSANQSPDFIVGSGIQGSPIGFFNPVIPTFFYKPIPANLFTFIGVTFFILRVPRFFVGVR